MIPERVATRFWTNVEIGAPDDCWLWKLSTGSHGYGQVGWWEGGKSVMRLAHRVAYEITNGPIPEGLEIDHVKARGCASRRCVNPAHLEPVTHGENVSRSGLNGAAAANAAKVRCPRGHAYDATRDRKRGRERVCLTCAAEANRRWRARAA